ncbi:MAG TPA: hypothetical protein PKY96_11860 [Flavobacteriales bacterium]|nr:hypothetical protein [Flavobacteriales bacterium]
MRAQGFVNTYGGQLSEEAMGVALSSSGFLVATRLYMGQAAGHQAHLLQLSSTGAQGSWLQLPGSDGRVFVQAMDEGTSGSAFVAGSAFPAGQSHHDGFVAKLDGDGGLLWHTRPSLDGDQQYFAVRGLPDGGCIAAGVRSIGEGHDAWVTRFSAFGLVQWHQAITDFADVEAHGITVQGNDVILSGRQLNFGGSTDAWIARLNLSGDVIWTSSWGGVRNETGRSVTAIGPGAFVLAGTTNSDVPFDVTEARYKDHIYLVAFDLNGDSLWTRAIGDTVFDRRCFAMDLAPNGDLLLAGERASILGAKFAPLVEANAILLVFWLIVWWLSRQKIFVRI